MIIDALLAAEPHMHIAQQVFKPEKYVYLTDDIMPRIESSTEPVSRFLSICFGLLFQSHCCYDVGVGRVSCDF